MKKILLCLFIWTACFSGAPPRTTYCAFCDPQVLESHIFYEDDLVLALCTHKPIFPGHCLIIPKRHVEQFGALSDEEAFQITRVIKKVDKAVQEVFKTTAYLLLQKNGKEVGQTVPHVHFHYIPRKTGENSTLNFLFKTYIANWRGPMDSTEMKELAGKMRRAIEEPTP